MILKYNILDENNIAIESSPSKDNDLSIIFESSIIFKNNKYPVPKSVINFNFLSTAEADVTKLYFITITHSKPNAIYYGYDASDRCIILCLQYLEIGKRYAIYGRLRRKSTLILECIKAEIMDYKSLCFKIY